MQRHWTTGRTKCSVRLFLDRFQSGANVTERVQSMMTGLNPKSDQRGRSTVGTIGRVRSGHDQRSISSRKVGFVPNGYFLSGLINRPPTGH